MEARLPGSERDSECDDEEGPRHHGLDLQARNRGWSSAANGENQPERTLTLLVCSTGLRISEALGLKWEDIDCAHSRINIVRACSGGVVSKPKTKASKAPVPLHPILEAFLRAWQNENMYSAPGHWVFASTRRKGKQPRVANGWSRITFVPQPLKRELCSREAEIWLPQFEALACYILSQLWVLTPRRCRLCCVMRTCPLLCNSTSRVVLKRACWPKKVC